MNNRLLKTETEESVSLEPRALFQLNRMKIKGIMCRQGWAQPIREKISGAVSTYEPNYAEVQLGLRVEEYPGILLGEKKCLE